MRLPQIWIAFAAVIIMLAACTSAFAEQITVNAGNSITVYFSVTADSGNNTLSFNANPTTSSGWNLSTVDLYVGNTLLGTYHRGYVGCSGCDNPAALFGSSSSLYGAGPTVVDFSSFVNGTTDARLVLTPASTATFDTSMLSLVVGNSSFERNISGNNATITTAPTAPVPEPASVLLLSSGLAALVRTRKKLQK